MFCQNCGSKNEDGSVFCMQCGAKLDAAPSNDKPTEKPAPAAQASAQPAPQPTPTQAQPAQGQPTTQPATQTTGQVPPQQQVPVQEGCIGAAWRDITNSKGWLGKSLLLGLLNAVPIVSFAATGYTQEWGIEVAKGKRENLPKLHFSNRALITGFFESVAWATYGLICFVAIILTVAIFSLVPFLPIVFLIAWFVFGFFYHGYISLASMRSALKMNFGSAYETTTLFKSFKKKPGSALGAYLIPSIVCKIITAIIVIICVLIFVAVLIPVVMNVYNAISGISSSSTDIMKVLGSASSIISSIQTGVSMVIGFGILLIIVVYASIMLLGGFEKLWRYRAFGHWIKMYAPEWVTEEDKNMKYLKI